MISKLTGTVSHKNERYIVLDVHGVGYKVAATFETIESLKDGAENTTLWTHLVVREDALDLYGFPTKDEVSFFELLISISGIGPKTALGILNVATIPALKRAVSSGDTSNLVKVSGIGKKNADKIVLELKGKLGDDEGEITLKEEVDALEALKSLGYTHKEAREALKEVSLEITSTSDRIKHALKILGK